MLFGMENAIRHQTPTLHSHTMYKFHCNATYYSKLTTIGDFEWVKDGEDYAIKKILFCDHSHNFNNFFIGGSVCDRTCLKRTHMPGITNTFSHASQPWHLRRAIVNVPRNYWQLLRLRRQWRERVSTCHPV